MLIVQTVAHFSNTNEIIVYETQQNKSSKFMNNSGLDNLIYLSHMKTVLVALTCFVLGGAVFYAYNNYSSLQKENESLRVKLASQSKNSINSMPETSIDISPTIEKKLIEEVKGGSIQGTLGYPASGIPELSVYAFEVGDNKKYFMVDTAANQTEFTIPNVTPGSYYVVAYAKGYTVSGGYTKMVPCGLSVDCKDHSLIEVVVKSGELSKGVEVKDWYAPEGTFPKKP